MQSPKSDTDEVDLCLQVHVSPVNNPGPAWPSALQSRAGSVPAQLEELHRDPGLGSPGAVVPGQSFLLTLKHSRGDLYLESCLPLKKLLTTR